MPIDLSESNLKIIQDIVKQYVPARPAYIFGSRVKGTARKFSDVDIAIGGTRPLSTPERAKLIDAFDLSDLPYRVDIVDLNKISPAFLALIEAEKVLI